MKRHGWRQGRTSKDGPLIEWKDGEFFVSLPMGGDVVEARWRPTVLSVVRVREIGVDEWSPGFETPISGCSFVGLKPDTEYEFMITYKNDEGEGPPAFAKARTNSKGELSGK